MKLHSRSVVVANVIYFFFRMSIPKLFIIRKGFVGTPIIFHLRIRDSNIVQGSHTAKYIRCTHPSYLATKFVVHLEAPRIPHMISGFRSVFDKSVFKR